MNAVREINRINQRELELGLAAKGSWHDEYKDSAYIFVGGLSYDLTEGDVITIFSQWGEIVDINLPRDKTTGKTKGFGFVMYEDQRSTVLAVDNMNGTQVLGRTIRVDHCRKYNQPGQKNKEGEHVAPEEPTYNAMPPVIEGSDDSESEESEDEKDDLDDEDPMAAFLRAEKKKEKMKSIKEGKKKRKHEGESKEERRARKEAKRAKRAEKEMKKRVKEEHRGESMRAGLEQTAWDGRARDYRSERAERDDRERKSESRGRDDRYRGDQRRDRNDRSEEKSYGRSRDQGEDSFDRRVRDSSWDNPSTRAAAVRVDRTDRHLEDAGSSRDRRRHGDGEAANGRDHESRSNGRSEDRYASSRRGVNDRDEGKVDRDERRDDYRDTYRPERDEHERRRDYSGRDHRDRSRERR